MHDRKKLLVLMFSKNPACLDLFLADSAQVKECGVIINEKGGTWTMPNPEDPARPRETYQIGQSRRLTKNHHFPPIGVFHRGNMRHLQAMVSAVSNFTKDL